jgi:hypothetical protein
MSRAHCHSLWVAAPATLVQKDYRVLSLARRFIDVATGAEVGSTTGGGHDYGIKFAVKCLHSCLRQLAAEFGIATMGVQGTATWGLWWTHHFEALLVEQAYGVIEDIAKEFAIGATNM